MTRTSKFHLRCSTQQAEYLLPFFPKSIKMLKTFDKHLNEASFREGRRRRQETHVCQKGFQAYRLKCHRNSGANRTFSDCDCISIIIGVFCARGGVPKLAYRECLFAVRGVQKRGCREVLAGFCNQRCVCDVFRTKHTHSDSAWQQRIMLAAADFWPASRSISMFEQCGLETSSGLRNYHLGCVALLTPFLGGEDNTLMIFLLVSARLFESRILKSKYP